LYIATNDTIFVPPTLGLDARTITLASSDAGMIYLASDLVDANSIYTASLRVTGGDNVVSQSAVIVEQRVRDFRETTSSLDVPESSILMPFASPFTEMRSGYFAGNWVRRPQMDIDRNSFLFPYGNKSADGVMIDGDQYVCDPFQPFTPGEGYLVRLQMAGGSQDDVYNGLGWTSDEALTAHDKDKFIFNGLPYASLGYNANDRTLFTGGSILNRTVNPEIAKSFTQNWVAGNSYTSAISGELIAKRLMELNTDAWYMPYLYVYHHGATHYEIHEIWDYTNNTISQSIPDIQAMGVFMVVVWRGAGQGVENLTIGSAYQVHSAGISATYTQSPGTGTLTRAARSTQSDKLILTLTPEDNPFVYSRSEIMLSTNTDNQNLSALMNPSNRLFHLYGTNQSGARLQRNALPFSAEKALLSVVPAANRMLVTLTVENAQDFATEVVELFDKKTNQWHDLRIDNTYTFEMSPNDMTDRFEVHFIRQQITTGLDNNSVSDWQVYTNGNELTITRLSASLLNELVRIHDTAGVLHIQQTISSVPEQRINIAELPTGVYMLSVQGKTVKFIK
jgi:hypothetical protein